MRRWLAGVLAVVLAAGPVGCAGREADLAEGPDPRLESELGWYRTVTYELDAKTGGWKLVESERGVGWSPEEWQERWDRRWGDLDED